MGVQELIVAIEDGIRNKKSLSVGLETDCIRTCVNNDDYMITIDGEEDCLCITVGKFEMEISMGSICQCSKFEDTLEETYELQVLNGDLIFFTFI